MKKIKIKKNYVLGVVVLGAILVSAISAGFALAESCPSMTTVRGTTVTFVGELTNTGGDTTTYVWFDYGKTNNFGLKTSEQALSENQMYCITVSDLSPCTTYYYRAGARNSAGSSYGETKTFTTSCGVTVDLKANGSDGLVSVSYGDSVTLVWNSTNADSCRASGDWSGNKPTSGSQLMKNLTSDKNYSISCSGNGGTESDSVKVNVSSAPSLVVDKYVRNLTAGTDWDSSISAEPNDVVSFKIKINGNSSSYENIVVRDVLSDKIIYRSDTLKINGKSSKGSIVSGLNLGDLFPYETKTVTFDASIAGPKSFNYGQTTLTNSTVVFSPKASVSNPAKIIVTKKAVAGAATTVSTGLTNNIFLDSFFLPLVITLGIIWAFKSHIIRFEEWLDVRKKRYQDYKAKKLLQIKITQIKTKEFFRKKLF